jgi:hypothetical protein
VALIRHKGHKKTKAGEDWKRRITDLGCIVCWKEFGHFTPGAVHHPLMNGRSAPDEQAICLCDPGHHKGAPSDCGQVSIHPDKARFVERYGTEEELLEETKRRLGLL